MSIRASAVSLSADDSEIPSDTGLCNYRIKVIFVIETGWRSSSGVLSA
jgi:hypothetical protein